MKTGASAIGQALTVSHTGSLSGEDAVYDALFARLGVIRVASPAQLLETLKLLCVAGPVGGRRVAGFTCSGGGATMLADGAEPLGLSFPAFPPDLAERLAGLLPPIATVSNPLDYTTPIWGQACRTGPVFDAALGSGADVAVLVQDYPAPGLDESKPLYRADADAFAAAARRAGVPAVLCSTIPENIDRETREHLAAQGVVPMQGIPEALTAVAQAAEWTAAAARIRVAPPEPLAPAPVPRAPCPCDEAEGKAEVARAGIAVPAGRVVGAAEAPEAAAALGFPVAAKMASPAVALGLRSSEAVARAVAEMRGRVARACPAALRDRFLVERMEPAPLAELVLGLRHDPQFGLVLTLGSGGILVELVGDATTLLMPTGPEEIAGAIAGLRAGRLLAGFRGRPAADLATVAGAIHGLARHVAASRGRIAELEINPLFVHERGVVAVDVLMHRADG
jgi:acyl-CoA synthetase (NDP forming)